MARTHTPPDDASVGSRTSHRARSRTVYLIGLAGLLQLVLYNVAPSASREWVYNVGATGFVVALGVGAMRFRRQVGVGWFLVLAGRAFALGGDYLWSYYETVLGIEAPYPSTPDVLYLLSYPLVAAGVLLLLRGLVHGAGIASLLDGLIITMGAALAVWVYLVTPAVSGQDLTLAERTVSSAYPLADLFLLAVLLIFVLRIKRPSGSFALLFIGLVCDLIADIVYGFQALSEQYATGDPIDSFWLIAYVAFAAAPYWPDEDLEVERQEEGLTNTRLGLLALAAMLAPGIVAFEHLMDRDAPVVAGACASAVLFLLAIGRMALFNHELEAAHDELESSQTELRVALDELRDAQHDRRLLLDRISRAAEDQRTQLAAELHDRPIQHLAAISYRLQRVARSLDRGDVPKARGLVGDIEVAVSAQVEELRTLMTELRPPVLDERGLLGALSDHARVMSQKSSVSIDVVGTVGEVLPEVETQLFRIATEALANIGRHASATHATVKATTTEHTLVLTVRDDGVGFDVDAIKAMIRQGHFGLAGMRERIELLGGTASYVSGPTGTILTFELPLAIACSPAPSLV